MGLINLVAADGNSFSSDSLSILFPEIIFTGVNMSFTAMGLQGASKASLQAGFLHPLLTS